MQILSERQKNELAYHQEFAPKNAGILHRPFSWDILEAPAARWWNGYWQMYAYLTGLDLKGKRVLVIGCGFGHDALLLSRLGADVYAFDLCPDSLAIARKLADREGLKISFEQMPAETMTYKSHFFEYIIARDILHHVDIPVTMKEIRRVAKTRAVLVVNEVYSHSVTELIRYSAVVEHFLYPRLQAFVYGTSQPYITRDERKLNETDIQVIKTHLQGIEFKKFFYVFANRLFPERYGALSKLDRLLLIMLTPLARFLAGRILFSGRIVK